MGSKGNSPYLERVPIHHISGEELRVSGRTVVVSMRSGGQVDDLGMVVVGGNGQSLVSRDY